MILLPVSPAPQWIEGKTGGRRFRVPDRFTRAVADSQPQGQANGRTPGVDLRTDGLIATGRHSDLPYAS